MSLSRRVLFERFHCKYIYRLKLNLFLKNHKKMVTKILDLKLDRLISNKSNLNLKILVGVFNQNVKRKGRGRQ